MMSLEEWGAEQVGPAAASEPEIDPGLFNIIEQIGVALDSGENVAELAAAIPPSMLFAFTLQTGLVWSEDFTFGVAQGQRDYLGYLKNGLLKRLADRLRGIQVETSEEVEGWVPLGEVHCPKVAGCEAVYSQETRSEKDLFISVKVAGFGGGYGRSRNFGLGYRIPTKEECIRVMAPTKGLVEYCRGPRGSFTRVSIQEIRDGFKVANLAAEQDPCQIPLRELGALQWAVFPYKVRSPQPPTEVSVKIEAGREWKPSLGIDLGAVSVGLDVSVKALKTFECEYHLVGPRDYSAFDVPDTFGYSWTW